MSSLQHESSETIDGPHGAGRIETVSVIPGAANGTIVSSNGNSSYHGGQLQNSNPTSPPVTSPTLSQQSDASTSGAGLGENARAALVTRGLAELGRLVSALGGRAETVAGLSGLGDLLLTCTGASSRNFRCGLALGKGRPLPEALAAAGGTVEGVLTAPALLNRAAELELPVVSAVAALLAGHATVADTVAALLARPLKDE